MDWVTGLRGLWANKIQTNRFKESDLQYSEGLLVPLPDPTDDTRLLASAATLGLGLIIKPGYQYKKAGIMLTLISDKAKRQQTLFDDPLQRAQSAKLMAAKLPAKDEMFGWLDSKPKFGTKDPKQKFGTFEPKQKFGPKKLRTTTSTTPRTTTAYEKYPIEKTSMVSTVGI